MSASQDVTNKIFYIGMGDFDYEFSGQNFINNLGRKQTESPIFLYAIQVYSQNRITNSFWSDGCFRITYIRTNRYDILVTFHACGIS